MSVEERLGVDAGIGNTSGYTLMVLKIDWALNQHFFCRNWWRERRQGKVWRQKQLCSRRSRHSEILRGKLKQQLEISVVMKNQPLLWTILKGDWVDWQCW